MAFYDVYIEGHYNRKLVKITNLTTAVYWSELLDIIEQVVRKHTFDNSGYFKLDRKYMEDRTGIQLEEQFNCEALLERLGVLERDPNDESRILVRLKEMTELIASDDVTILEGKKFKEKISKAQQSANKKAAVIATMKRCATEFESDKDLLEKYSAWVDSVYAAGRFLTKVKIKALVDAVNAATTDKSSKSAIIDIGIQTGYDNAEWIMNKYNSNTKSVRVPSITGTIIAAPQKVATSVKDDVFF